MRPLDIFGIILVFGIVALIGWRSSKKVKSTDDFLMAGSQVNRIGAAFSLAATDVGGASIVGTVAFAYTVGLSGVWWLWASAPAYILLGTFFIRKLKPLAIETVPEFLERRYSKSARYLSSIMQICTHAAALAAQFTVAAVSLNIFAGIDKNLTLIISAVFVLLYTMAGGLLAVINTDVFQYIIIIVSVLIMLPICLSDAGGLSGLKEALPPEFFRLDQIGFWTPLSWMLLCFYSYGTNQPFLDRAFSAKDTKTAVFSYNFTGIQYFVLGLIMTLIAMTSYVLLPGMKDTNSIYPNLIREYMPVGIAGIALGGVFCAAMSSANSRLIAVTHLFINDIYKPLFRKNAGDREVLRISRITTVIACAAGCGVSYISDNLFQIIYVCGVFYAAAVFFPLILGVFNRRVNSAGAMSGIIVAIVVGALRQFIFTSGTGLWGLPTNILASSAGLIVLIVVTLLTPPPTDEQLAILTPAKKMDTLKSKA